MFAANVMGSNAGLGLFTATGGSSTTDGAYTVRTFTATTSFVISAGTRDIEYLVIGGGSGGKGGYNYSVTGYYYSSHGGCAGEHKTGTLIAVGPGTYTVTIGAGGAGGAGTSQTDGAAGGSSVFLSVTAAGASVGTSGNGYALGVDYFPYVDRRNGGGGAGAAANGGDAATTTAGSGGSGISSSITGVSIARAGGGGGGNISVGAGGAGAAGGGTGYGYGPTAATNAAANTGSGGGGGGKTFAGSAGGSGVVIIRYLT